MSNQMALNNVQDKFEEIRRDLQIKREEYQAKIKKIADAMPYPQPSYNSTMSDHIRKAWIKDDCIFYNVYGPLRIGKSAYSLKSLASLYNTWDPEVLKLFIVYKPEELPKALEIPKKYGKQPALLWDDAGVHLSAMKWGDPLLRRICELMNLIGTLYGAVIFTTPLPTYVVKKIRGLPSSVNVKIKKGENDYASKARVAQGYYQWLSPDMKKSGVKGFINDDFYAIMPTKFYEWYQKYRESYNDQNFKELEASLYLKAQEELSLNNEVKVMAKTALKHDEVLPIDQV